MKHRKTALALAAVTAIAAPAAAVAAPGNGASADHANPNAYGHGPHAAGEAPIRSNGVGPAKGVAYVFKGTYAGDSTVTVTRGNAHVRKAELVGTDVAFDLSAAKLSVADTNGDSAVTIDDVAAGDKVVVKAKLPKGHPGVAPYAARQLVDQTHPEDEETVAPSGE